MIMMHMPQRSASASNPGTFVHQIFVEHPSKDLRSFIHTILQDEYIIVKELYKDPDGKFKPSEEIALNYKYIAKVKVMG
jgi:hypothetical protein